MRSTAALAVSEDRVANRDGCRVEIGLFKQPAPTFANHVTRICDGEDLGRSCKFAVGQEHNVNDRIRFNHAFVALHFNADGPDEMLHVSSAISTRAIVMEIRPL